jgi:predicted PurR-regulated permease PerM
MLFYLFVHFIGQAVAALPAAAAKAVPTLAEWAQAYGIKLPFTTPETLKEFALSGIKEELREVAKFAEIFTKESVYVLIGIVAACGLFTTPYLDLAESTHAIPHNVYSCYTRMLKQRFSLFFESFRTIMGAQLIISAVNTIFTGLFILTLSLLGTPLPYSFVIVVVTFLCGILPIVGNLISNTIIFSLGLTQSAQLAVISLLYLIVLHKFEYFLNSRIIGGRINNPMWITLLGLLLGERLMGIPGMILAPVVLNYVKLEGIRIPALGAQINPASFIFEKNE